MRYWFWIVAVLLIASPASAKEWVVDYTNSHIGFTGTQGSAAFEGGFKKFQIAIDFDPAKPEAGKITATIDTGSAFAGSDERDSALPQSDWFNVSKFPQAQFVTTAIRKTGEQAYEASGTLTIRGVAKSVTLPFTLKPEGDHMRAQGKVVLMRNDFGIGQGDWASEAYVKHAVAVVVDVAAH